VIPVAEQARQKKESHVAAERHGAAAFLAASSNWRIAVQAAIDKSNNPAHAVPRHD